MLARHIRWDEVVIAEHDKERGTRQRIDEPSTPYHSYVAESDDGAGGHRGRARAPSLATCVPSTRLRCRTELGKSPRSPASVTCEPAPAAASEALQALHARLQPHAEASAAMSASCSPASTASARRPSGDWESSGDELDRRPRKRVFEARRRAHYDEFQRVKELRAKMAAGEMSEDEDDASAGGGGEAAAAALQHGARGPSVGRVVRSLEGNLGGESEGTRAPGRVSFMQ